MLVHVQERRPRADVWGLEHDIHRIFGSVLSDWGVPAGNTSFGLAVMPDKDGVTLRAEVPGVEPSAINIAVNGRALTISGERTAEKRSEGKYQLRERRYGKFSRTFFLSDDLDAGAIDAQCRDGVLSVRIPKQPEANPRQIEVKAS
jgi:HSP20 family protein